MKIILSALQALRNQFKQIQLRLEESAVEDPYVRLLHRALDTIKVQLETIRMLSESIRLGEEDAEKYPNIDFGIKTAKYLLLRGLHLQLKDRWRLKSWEHEFGIFSKYSDSEDVRGGKGFIELKVKAIINRSWYSPPDPPLSHSVYAHLHIACATSEHFWVPNHSGSYVCIDGKECFEIQCDWGTGNIAIGGEGRGSHIPEWFKKEAVLATSEVSAQEA